MNLYSKEPYSQIHRALAAARSKAISGAVLSRLLYKIYNIYFLLHSELTATFLA
jgi:hypothetical protein